MVRLKVIQVIKRNVVFRCFNSTMVRLKENATALPASTLNAFQFHNGSIKSHDGIGQWYQKAEFQFHNGSIKSPAIPFTNIIHFEFQFHNGSIKS